ncbi:hypothetical protein BGX38DRAFT_1334065 [Terfezia claveryi]|nr:hypothetical protein BGX38DRAFT_1334065 [Terfezia claveryi]
MSTNSYPVQDVLGAELLEFLTLHNWLTWDEGTKLWILMSSKITGEMLDNLIWVIVEEWIENGITKMSEFGTLKRMNSDRVVAIVEEQVTDEMLDTLIWAIAEDWMENGIANMSEFETLKGMNLDQVVGMVKKQVTAYLAQMEV